MTRLRVAISLFTNSGAVLSELPRRPPELWRAHSELGEGE